MTDKPPYRTVESGRSPSPDPRVAVIANVLIWNLEVTDEGGWAMDEDSPRSMAEKIVAALDGETAPARTTSSLPDSDPSD